MSRPIHIPILLYHKVNEKSRSTTTRPGVFRAHLQWLAERGWRSLTLAEFEAVVAGQQPAEPKRFLLTYDDGSSDLIHCTAEMEAFGFTGVAFLITGRIQQADPQCISAADAVHLAQQGTLEFQSHTHRHEHIEGSTRGLEDLVVDLTESRTWFEEVLGMPQEAMRHLAWPWGECTPNMESTACEMGFDWQYLVQRGSITHASTQLRLPRLCADGMSAAKFSNWMTLMSSRPGGQLLNYLFGTIRRARHGMAYW
jgi:peptidoglycan/xylan/chitin deacetylase (PgdA/CDA1 family)